MSEDFEHVKHVSPTLFAALHRFDGPDNGPSASRCPVCGDIIDHGVSRSGLRAERVIKRHLDTHSCEQLGPAGLDANAAQPVTRPARWAEVAAIPLRSSSTPAEDAHMIEESNPISIAGTKVNTDLMDEFVRQSDTLAWADSTSSLPTNPKVRRSQPTSLLNAVRRDPLCSFDRDSSECPVCHERIEHGHTKSGRRAEKILEDHLAGHSLIDWPEALIHVLERSPTEVTKLVRERSQLKNALALVHRQVQPTMPRKSASFFDSKPIRPSDYNNSDDF